MTTQVQTASVEQILAPTASAVPDRSWYVQDEKPRGPGMGFGKRGILGKRSPCPRCKGMFWYTYDLTGRDDYVCFVCFDEVRKN